MNGQFQFTRDKTVYINHYYFYIDDEDRTAIHQGMQLGGGESRCASTVGYEALDNGLLSYPAPEKLQQICDSLGPEHIEQLRTVVC